MNLVCFDFDGTITYDDSLLGFIAYVVGFKKFFKGVLKLSPILVGYKLKIISNNFARRALLTHFFKGMSEDKFARISYKYSATHIDDILIPKAMQKIKQYKENGDKIVIVSASLEDWLKPWCDKMDLGLLATKIERKNGVITGEILGKNCYAKEKVRRIKETFDLSKFDKIIAYGDSRGDKEMIEFADEGYYKFFNE